MLPTNVKMSASQGGKCTTSGDQTDRQLSQGERPQQFRTTPWKTRALNQQSSAQYYCCHHLMNSDTTLCLEKTPTFFIRL